MDQKSKSDIIPIDYNTTDLFNPLKEIRSRAKSHVVINFAFSKWLLTLKAKTTDNFKDISKQSLPPVKLHMLMKNINEMRVQHYYRKHILEYQITWHL